MEDQKNASIYANTFVSLASASHISINLCGVNLSERVTPKKRATSKFKRVKSRESKKWAKQTAFHYRCAI